MHTAYIRGALRFAAAMGLVLGAAAAHAEYPDKPIQIVSPYAAGGANDSLTRLMAKNIGEELKANVVAENRAGANGIVGASYVAKSAPDGYTLLMGNSATHGTNPTLYANLSYDALKDFAPVGMVGAVPIVLAVNKALNINTVQELIAYGKKHPSKLSFGSSGVGGTGHLAGEAFKAATGLDMVHIPYKGDAPAVTDAMGGQVSMAFVGVASAAPQMQSGRIKIIAVANKQRLASLPDVPTLAEAGLKDLEFMQWYALVTRAGAPAATIDKLNLAIKASQGKEDVKKTMASLGAEAINMTPAELAAFINSEITRFGKIIRDLNIQPS